MIFCRVKLGQLMLKHVGGCIVQRLCLVVFLNNQTHIFFSFLFFQWHFPVLDGNGLMNGEAKPQLRNNIHLEGGSVASCSQCGLLPLVGVDWDRFFFSIGFVLFVFFLYCGLYYVSD